LGAPEQRRFRRAAPASLSARLRGGVTLEAHASGEIVACFNGYRSGFGLFSAGAADRAQKLRKGLPLSSFASGAPSIDKEMNLLARRLATRGLLEYRLGDSLTGADLAVIEPQMADYWPRTPPLGDADALVLSRFAYLRGRGDEMVLESPRAGALFKICDPKIAADLALLAAPQEIKELRKQGHFPGVAFLALLADCQILLKVDARVENGHRPFEGDDNLALWDFHDLLFHARSTQGRHANPVGGTYPGAGVVPPSPAVRPSWPGKKIDLGSFSSAQPGPISAFAKLLRERHSTRSFDAARPITLAELSQFLDGAARALSRLDDEHDLDDGGRAFRPYPSAGASYALELYLAVDRCEGLNRGFYHYDAGAHALASIDVAASALEELLMGAAYAMGVAAAPQILITIGARFGRISWKYSSIAYSLLLKDAGVLTQTFYLMATDMGLGGCAIGIVNIELFARMTAIDFHVEGPVGQFALGRGAKSETSR
jgi:SagB-type dehydrogenase family enzyme